MTAETKGQILF